MSEKEGCFVSRRDDRVSHPILTAKHNLKRNIFWTVAIVDHSCEILVSLVDDSRSNHQSPAQL